MKITLIPKRELIVLFLKILISIAVLFCVFKFAEFVYDFSGFEEIKYENSFHVLKIFKENENDFNSMVGVLKKTNINKILFDDFMDNPKSIMLCPGDSLKNPKFQIRRKGLLEKEDYYSICDFFKKFGPAYIEGYNEFCFVFCTKDDSVVYLYYFPKKNSDTVLEHIGRYHNKLIPINETWYFAE